MLDHLRVTCQELFGYSQVRWTWGREVLPTHNISYFLAHVPRAKFIILRKRFQVRRGATYYEERDRRENSCLQNIVARFAARYKDQILVHVQEELTGSKGEDSSQKTFLLNSKVLADWMDLGYGTYM